MIAHLTQGSGWALVAQIDLLSRFILVSLFGLSVVCTAIFVSKMKSLHDRKKRAEALLVLVKNAKKTSDLKKIASKLSESEGKDLLVLASADCKTGELRSITCEHHIEHMTMCDERAAMVLGVSAAASPLVGLLGTVWGLIHALLGIGAVGNADLSMIAPGIAEALLTTLAGLIVAIPALIFSQVLSQRSQKVEWLWFAISDRVQALIDQD